MKECIFITPADARFGFDLAGLDQAIAAPDNLLSVLQEILAGNNYGLIFVDERLLQTVDPLQLRVLENRWQAVIVALPAPEKGEEEEDYALQLIRRACGYHVRLHL